MVETNLDKWTWKMEYCKDNNLPPAQKWAWDKAEIEYLNYIRDEHK